MKTLRNWRLERQHENGVDLAVDARHILRLRVLENALVRVSLLRNGVWRLGRTWSIAPDGTDVPWEGRSRDADEGFANPACEVEASDETLKIETETLRVTISTPLALRWEYRATPGSEWQPLAEDRATGAYMLGVSDSRNEHFLRRFPGEFYYGLGEKAGPLERSGKRYEMRNLDAMGYNAASTDPLYKHIPFTITERPGGAAEAGAMGVFYDNLSTCWFDMGNELDNYHLPYRAYRAADGDLDYYVSWAPTVLELVKMHHALIGGTAFMPRWGLGYSGSSMAYTDAPDAQEQMEGFLGHIDEHDIPCDSFQMSSGYTSIGPCRYVFNWNTEKFPDAKSMSARYADAGIQLIANIKPVLLDDHPLYGEAAAKGLFIADSEDGKPQTSAFWDGYGSHLDFTNPDTVKWWQDNVQRQLLDYGIGCTWNDNNEYEIWDDAATCKGFGEEIDISLIRPLHGMLMTRASYEVQARTTPDKRPYLISRCAAPGTQRYAQSWTGDNRTGWDTLRWNVPMGLGLSLSGFYNIGHDVGGFAGEKPEPELFLRWVQNGIFHPRFTIHSWNDDGSVNEAWMHPEVTDHVRDAIKLRYRLLPYLYTALYCAVAEGEPMLRPFFLDTPEDDRARARETEFLLGQDLLVATVIEEGAGSREIYLPENETGWCDFHTGEWHASGTTLTVPVTLASIPLFVRAGAVLPLAGDVSRSTVVVDKARTLRIFSQPEGAAAVTSFMYEDDGESVDALASRHLLTELTTSRSDGNVCLDWISKGGWRPTFGEVTVETAGSAPSRLLVNGTVVESGSSVPL